MFETLKESEIYIPQIFENNGVQIWPFVVARGGPPLFAMEYASTIEEFASTSLVFLSTVRELLLYRESTTVEVGKYYIVAQQSSNNSFSWSMDVLSEILVGEVDAEHDEATPTKKYVYRLENGYSFTGVGGEGTLDLINLKSICIF